MTSHLVALCIDAGDPAGLARFWSGLLGWTAVEDAGDHHGAVLVSGGEPGFPVRFLPGALPKTVQNRLHPDLTSASLEDQRATVARAVALGARPVDVGQGPDEEHVVLADPEGNEFCVIEPGNSFLAGCGVVGALACDGSQAVGYFWSQALGWPLVWDRDQETAIQSPRGGPKITWGGEEPDPHHPRSRLHLDIAPPADGDQPSEIERLLALGARRLDSPATPSGRIVLADPDGTEFCVLTPR